MQNTLYVDMVMDLPGLLSRFAFPCLIRISSAARKGKYVICTYINTHTHKGIHTSAEATHLSYEELRACIFRGISFTCR